MRKLRFLVPPGALSRGAGAEVDLPEEEARHLAVTLRAQPGLQVFLFDGAGEEWKGEVVEATRKRASVRLREPETASVESPLRVVVFQAVSVARVFEESIEPLTALGVAAIVPLLTERSRTRSPDAKRIGRWRRIAGEASKLSFRRIVPRIDEPIELSAIAPADPETRRLLLDPDATAGSFRAALTAPAPRSVELAAGPEGGFAPQEIEHLFSRDFVPVCLGPRILRTQLAAPAALSILMAAWSDMA